MTEKKIPTAQQMKEYRLLRRTMTTADEHEKVMAFEEEYDIESGSEYLQVVKDGVNGYIDESGEFTTEEDERFFHASCD